MVFELPANRTYDLVVADIDGDGREELYVWNQGAETLFGIPLPDDPHASPWPGAQPVVTGVKTQAIAVADVDGDDRPELIAGLPWSRRGTGIKWTRHIMSDEFDAPRLAVGGFDGDGRTEIAVCETQR